MHFKRPAGSSGKEVKQQLHNTCQACLNNGIQVDYLSQAEHLFYIYQLSLSPTQSTQFLDSLSSNQLESDNHLRTITPTGEADRRASAAGPHSSSCVWLLSRRSSNGDGGSSGGVWAAVTTG